jgi:rod shape-determining protein MreC
LKNLVQFVIANVHWLLFCLFLYLSVSLIVNNNQYQRSQFLQITQEIAGNIYSATNSVRSYLRLKSVNAVLLERLSQLETEVHGYRDRLESLDWSQETPTADSLIYRFIPAKVVNNNVSHTENYLTLNKGSDDGVLPDMGVLSPGQGVIGVVIRTSPHFSTVVSLLNTKYKPNAQILGSNYFGPLVWDGSDPRYSYLTEIPRFAVFSVGDTVVTSGYSTVFPKGIPIGSIVEAQKQRDNSAVSLRIRLFANFRTLSEALVVANRYQHEQRELETHTAPMKSTQNSGY